MRLCIRASESGRLYVYPSTRLLAFVSMTRTCTGRKGEKYACEEERGRSLSRGGAASALGQRTDDLENFDLRECSRERVFFFETVLCAVQGEDVLGELVTR